MTTVSVRLSLAVIPLTIAASLGWAQSPTNHVRLAKASTANTLPAIYQRWVDEDVRWIITPAQRAAFRQLKTNDARDEFIERFWEQRDPTPGTGRNEFKEEHYRRIAYSNEHFATSAQGWQSDRGHIYIVYGPPNEVTRGTSNGIPDETWRYSSIAPDSSVEDQSVPPSGKAELEFVDKCKCNDYRLTMPEVH